MSSPVGLVRLHDPLVAQRRRAARDGRLPPPARDRVRRARPSSTTSALLLDRHRDDRVAAVHAGQRHRLRALAALPGPDHHARDAGARAQRDPRRPRRRQLRRGRHLEGAQRGRRHPGGERRDRRVGERLGARARAAPRPHPARPRRQARAALRAGHGAGRPRPSRARGGATTVLTADLVDRRAGAATSCASSPSTTARRARVEALAAALCRPSRARTSGRPRGASSTTRSTRGRGRDARRRPAPRRPPSRSWCSTAAASRSRTPRRRRPCAASSSAAPPRPAGRRPPSAPFDRDARARRGRGASASTTAAAIEAGLYADRPGAPAPARASRLPRPAALAAGFELAEAQAVLLRATKVTATVRARDAGDLPPPLPDAEVPAPAARRSRRPPDGGVPDRARRPVQPVPGRHALRPPARRSRCRRSPPATAGRSTPTSAGAPTAARSVFAWRGRGRATPTPTAAAAAPRRARGVRRRRSSGSTAAGASTASRRCSICRARALCVPDLAFVRERDGARVHFELLGFWSREAVWRRVELVRAGLPHRILFAVSRSLRVGEAVLDDSRPPRSTSSRGCSARRRSCPGSRRSRARRCYLQPAPQTSERGNDHG